MHQTLNWAIHFASDVTLKVTFLFAITGLLLLLMRRSSAAARHLVGTIGLAAAMLLPVVSLAPARVALPFLPDVRPGLAVGDSALVLGRETPGDPAAREAMWRRLALSVPEKPLEAPLEFLGTRPALARTSERGMAPMLFGSVLALWLLGALAVSARLGIGWLRVRRIAREAEPVRDADWIAERDALALRLSVRRKVELKESPEVPVAMTAGLFKPLLLIGRTARLWAVERRRVVLLHELAHVKRGDWAAVLLAELAVALYWFHPLAWWLGRRVRRDAEKASDDLVIASGIKPSVYAGHLLGIFRAMASPVRSVTPALPAVRPSHFEERLRAILDPRAMRLWPPSGSARWAAAGLLAAATAVAVVEPWAPNPKQCPHARSASPLSLASAQPEVAPSELEADSEDSSPSTDAVVHAVRTEPAVALGGMVKASNGKWKRNKSDWYDRGMRLHRDERYPEAIEAFEKAIAEGNREDAASYNIACGYALMGNADAAFQWLERAREAGFDLAAYIGHDDDLDNLRSDARWVQLKQSARAEKDDSENAKAKAVAERYERVAAKAAKSGEPFFRIGRELLEVERYDLAAKAFQGASDRGYRTGTSLYNQACAFALADDRDRALDLLAKALDAGFDDPHLFRTDDDLDSLRSDPRFATLQREAADLSLPGNGMEWLSHTSRFKWRQVADRLHAYAREHPEKGRAWFNLGFASLAVERPDAAAAAFRKALDLKYRDATTMYNLACAYAHLDQKDAAFEWSFRSLDAGFGETGTLRSD
ncbi:MAG: M56 family metallopeptidase, partial [Acidobacteriota bacterium]